MGIRWLTGWLPECECVSVCVYSRTREFIDFNELCRVSMSRIKNRYFFVCLSFRFPIVSNANMYRCQVATFSVNQISHYFFHIQGDTISVSNSNSIISIDYCLGKQLNDVSVCVVFLAKCRNHRIRWVWISWWDTLLGSLLSSNKMKKWICNYLVSRICKRDCSMVISRSDDIVAGTVTDSIKSATEFARVTRAEQRHRIFLAPTKRFFSFSNWQPICLDL